MSGITCQPRSLVPVGLPMRRAWRWCLLSTLRQLRRSVESGRTMGLPAVLRLFSRRWTEVVANERGGLWDGDELLSVGRGLLRAVYVANQPFDAVDWIDVRRGLEKWAG